MPGPPPGRITIQYESAIVRRRASFSEFLIHCPCACHGCCHLQAGRGKVLLGVEGLSNRRVGLRRICYQAMDVPLSICDRAICLQSTISAAVAAKSTLCTVSSDSRVCDSGGDYDAGSSRGECRTVTYPERMKKHPQLALAIGLRPRSRSPPSPPGLRLSRGQPIPSSETAESTETVDTPSCDLPQDPALSNPGAGPDEELRALGKRLRVQLQDLLLRETEKMSREQQTALLQLIICRLAEAENDEALQEVTDFMRRLDQWEL